MRRKGEETAPFSVTVYVVSRLEREIVPIATCNLLDKHEQASH